MRQRLSIQQHFSRGNAAAEVIGIRGVVVHAVPPEAKAFYLAVGFEVSPLQPMTSHGDAGRYSGRGEKRVNAIRGRFGRERPSADRSATLPRLKWPR